jgi:hypothetical protein
VPELATQRGRVDVVHERALAVDLHDRQPLAITGLEVRIAGDVDLLELELVLPARSGDSLPGPPTEVAALCVVENDPGGYG